MHRTVLALALLLGAATAGCVDWEEPVQSASTPGTTLEVAPPPVERDFGSAGFTLGPLASQTPVSRGSFEYSFEAPADVVDVVVTVVFRTHAAVSVAIEGPEGCGVASSPVSANAGGTTFSKACGPIPAGLHMVTVRHGGGLIDGTVSVKGLVAASAADRET